MLQTGTGGIKKVNLLDPTCYKLRQVVKKWTNFIPHVTNRNTRYKESGQTLSYMLQTGTRGIKKVDKFYHTCYKLRQMLKN